MTRVARAAYTSIAIVAVIATLGKAAAAQEPYRLLAPTPPAAYTVIEHWGELPEGRTWGATSAVYPDPEGNLWVAERCGANLCVESDVDPVLLFDPSGKVLKSFGAGRIAWPHGIHVDHEGNVWIADAVGYAPVPEGWGHVVYKFRPDGELLMTLGSKGVAGQGEDTFTKPSDVVVAPNGDIFIADGHDADGNNRIVKLSSDGTFIKAWGQTGGENGEFRDPHALAMDSQGRLFVGDRGNSRIQLFDQDGKHLATWTQFGRPSGIYIDENDVIYVADSESNTARNPGWERGIRIGSARTGWVTTFLPDPEPDPDSSGTSGAEGVAVDAEGNIYGAEVGPQMMKKYVKQ